MDDGKPTEPKPKWWSRPARHAVASPEADTPAHGTPADGIPGTPQVPAPAPEPAPVPARPQPLHQPDEYRTPPYGEPGPWAPAPPVQRPGPTPAQGTAVPPAYGTPPPAAPQPGTPQPGTPQHHQHAQPAVPPQAPPPHPPQPQPQPQQPQATQWLQYDPWSTPGGPRQPLTHSGGPVPHAPRKGRRRGLAVVAALLFAGLTGVLGGGVGAYIERHGGLTTVELPQAGADEEGRAPDSVAGIAASALPGVVTLHVSGGGEQGTGTGFVLDERGHILTNHHVVDPAGTSGDITVTFSGGETAAAELVGKDSGYDLAVVRVKGVSNLRPLPLGNSDNVRVGDPVVAIGAPFDLQNTVTSGIISAKERPITAGGEKGDGSDISYVDALQTDAPINPGNSGGPLLDSKARVIGINSAIRAADSGSGAEGGQAGSIGLGFAIPVNQGKRVAEELINTGKASHPVIGVSLDMKYSGDGARVGDKAQDGGASVTPGGPAAKAGVRPGDVITRVDGQRVHSGEELIVKIRAHRPGDRLRLTLERGGKEQTRTLTLGSASGG
ncbi:S1C family serine protease [Streptomyces ficellus]|uniref:PDZ domain-containing protein n=1 Tax=Streptomyces ficellus TaxID=1977088 RepID=A0A6I6FCR6_9ACTN|nr:trypsin-like peptidase domain-containing protein [Streptomyces ficellus]QGV78727.1 PDZ domain-containing protein [Streptomyces ficellus]